MKIPRRIGAKGIAVLLWGTALSVGAQTAPVFEPTGDFEVVVDGGLDEAARVLQAEAMPAVLVVSGALPTPVLIHARSRRVEAVPQERLTDAGNGLRLERGDSLSFLGVYDVQEGQIQFQYDAQRLVLRPRAPLTGLHDVDELFEHSPEYRKVAEVFRLDPTAVDKLRQVDEPIRVRVVFGSWCHVCQNYLPRGLKMQQALGSSPIRFEYFGLPAQGAWEHPEVKRLQVTQLPTAIVFRGDTEIGRYEGAEGWDHPERELLRAIEAGS